MHAPNYQQRRHRAEVAAGPPKSNITKKKRKALGELKKSTDLLIMGADKGKCTVVQGKEDYEKKRFMKYLVIKTLMKN